MSILNMRTPGKLTRQFKAASICRFATPPVSVATGRRCHFGGKASQRRQWTELVCKLLSYRMTTGIDKQGIYDIGNTATNFNAMG